MKTPEILISMARKFNDQCSIVDTIEYYPTGSAYTCNPPSTDTDEDWLVCHLGGDFGAIYKILEADGYEGTTHSEQYPECLSFRKEKINVIVCFHPEFYRAWVKATEVCRNLNLRDKEARKIVHHILCDEDLTDMLPKFVMGMDGTP